MGAWQLWRLRLGANAPMPAGEFHDGVGHERDHADEGEDACRLEVARPRVAGRIVVPDLADDRQDAGGSDAGDGRETQSRPGGRESERRQCGDGCRARNRDRPMRRHDGEREDPAAGGYQEAGEEVRRASAGGER